MRMESNFDSFMMIMNRSNKNNQTQDESNQKIKDYIMFLDSQGMLSVEVDDKEIDRKIATYLLGISRILLINFSGDFCGNLKNLLELSNYSYRPVSYTHLTLPTKA